METFLGIMIPFLGTTLGAACVFFMKKSLGDLVQRALAGFALRFYLFLLKPASSRYSGCSFTYGS